MSEERCPDCGAAVALLAPECPTCGAQSTGTTAPCTSCGARVDHLEPGSCPSCHAAVSPWDAVVQRARAAGFHVPLAVSDAVPHPVAAGFEPGRGKPAGQDDDYRRPLADGTELHVRAYDDHYEAHLDRRSADDRVAHLARDAPLETVAGATALSLFLLGARRLRTRLTSTAPDDGAGQVPGDDREEADGREHRVGRRLPAGVADRVPLPSLPSRVAGRLPSRPFRSRGR
jgi:hypothetical protein